MPPDTQKTGGGPILKPPPCGDSKRAEKYLCQLIGFLNADKIISKHTDLSKYDPSSLQDHYWLELSEYQVEVSHSKQPDSGKDVYVLLFNNLKNVRDGCTEKVILAYMHLEESQFRRFKSAADEQVERKRKAEEEKRLGAALVPIDKVFDSLMDGHPESEYQPQQDQKSQDGHGEQYQSTTYNPSTKTDNQFEMNL